MVNAGFSYPSLGPLLGTTFDKAVGIMVSRWKLLLVVTVAGVLFGSLSPAVGVLVFRVFEVYWEYASLANAVRLFDPSYRMRGRRVLTILGINIGVPLATLLGLLFFIVPGLWVGNKYSLSAIIAAAEDTNMRQATERSWALTTGAFWPTLWFNLAVFLGYFGVIVAGELLLDSLSYAMTRGLGPIQTGTPTGNAVLMAALAVDVVATAYATQALVVAQRYWLRALVEREQTAPLSAPATA